MSSPPSPPSYNASPKTYGTILHYGVEEITVTGLLVDSYKRSGKYAKTEEVVGQDGIVQGVRLSDFRAEVSVSGRATTVGALSVKVGDVLVINGDSILVMSIDLSASGTGFSTYDISGTAFEGVSGLSPA